MKNVNMKKFLCLMLALVALMSFLAVGVFAQEVDDAASADAAETATAQEDSVKDEAPKMIFEPANFIKNINYMGVGMLGIFIVIGVIILCTMALNKVFKEKK